MEPTDGELLERAKKRDCEAFAHLVDRYKDAMVNYLARLTGCRDRAEDVAQETFVRLFQGLDRYRDQGHLVAYLYRIATNLVRSEERRKRRWQILLPRFSPTSEPANGKGPQEHALASEEQRQVSRALAAIDLIYRAPLVLREIEGCSYLEIAEVLGVSEGTVKSRLHRGRHLLKEELAPYWSGARQGRGARSERAPAWSTES